MGKFYFALARSGVKISSEETQAMRVASRALEDPVPIGIDILKPLKKCLLTLEQDISSESINQFKRALASLNETLGENPHRKAVIVMAFAVCEYLRVRKYLASPLSMQFLHKVTRVLQLFDENQQNESIKGKNLLLEMLLLDFRLLKKDLKGNSRKEAVSNKLKHGQTTTNYAERAETKEEMLAQLKEIQGQVERILQSAKQIVTTLENNQNF